MSWYLRVDGKVHGPIDDKRFSQLEFGGKIPKNAEKSQSESGPWVAAIVDDGTAAVQAKIAEEERLKAEQDKYAHLYDDDDKPRSKGNNRNADLIKGINAAAGTFAFFVWITNIAIGVFLCLSVAGLVLGIIYIVTASWVSFVAYHILRNMLAGSHYYTQRLREMGDSQ
jgi:hypothetical protein